MQIATKTRPIIFSGSMARAILNGRKTQTRRVCKQAHSPYTGRPAEAVCRAVDWTWIAWWGESWEDAIAGLYPHGGGIRCPYGQPGDRLWVRETFAFIPSMKPSGYFTDPKWIDRVAWYAADNDKPTWGGRWRSPIHMPRFASRLTLELTEVRIDRLQYISGSDADAEGVDAIPEAPAAFTHRTSFAKLWDKLNAPRGYMWESNPWVWCLSFRVLGKT